MTESFHCGECGGIVTPRPGIDRTRSLEYGKPLPVPDDFLILTCGDCGETYMDPDTSDVLDRLLAELEAVKP